MDKKLLQSVLRIAIDAGEEILNIYNTSDFEIVNKKDNTPVTKADKAAHIIITRGLQQISTYPILSEEGKHTPYEERKSWNTFWLVDPLDGTKEFIKRNDQFTVNIALIKRQAPIFGIVYVPVTGAVYYNFNHKSYKSKRENNTDKIIESALELPLIHINDEYIVLGSRSHLSEETKNFISNLKIDKPIRVEQIGSSLKFCMIAEGKAHCYPRLGPTMEWDTAAGHAIAKYAGFSVNTYPENKPMIYNKENLLNPFFIVG